MGALHEREGGASNPPQKHRNINLSPSSIVVVVVVLAKSRQIESLSTTSTQLPLLSKCTTIIIVVWFCSHCVTKCDVVKLSTHLSVVQTGGQTLSLTARWPLRQRSPSWCCLCTSPPLKCTGHPHWTELKSKEMFVTKKSYQLQVWENRRQLEDADGDFVLHLQTTKHTQGVYPKKKPLSRTFSPSVM